jgi:hypothetical protein
MLGSHEIMVTTPIEHLGILRQYISMDQLNSMEPFIRASRKYVVVAAIKPCARRFLAAQWEH